MPDVGILLSPLTAGVIGLGLRYSAYTAEVYRAGIDNVPKGQWEAAKAVNLSPRQTWSHIIIPQAVPPMIPALANDFVAERSGRKVTKIDALDGDRRVKG